MRGREPENEANCFPDKMCAPEHISLVISVPWPPEQISHITSASVICVSRVNCFLMYYMHEAQGNKNISNQSTGACRACLGRVHVSELYLLIKAPINIERTVDLCVITKKKYTCTQELFKSGLARSNISTSTQGELSDTVPLNNAAKRKEHIKK